MLVTIIALIWINSSVSESYNKLLHTHFELKGDWFTLDTSVHFWINEGLMTIFFFVVGLEIKREILIGELASFKQAALPVAAAIGGMVAPALIYYVLNPAGPAAKGWGIPMATDIAFTIGALTLLGSRVPHSLKVFLAALAIVDDLGAVLVIAIFYTPSINQSHLLQAVFLFSILVSFNILGYRRALPYVFIGVLVWIEVFLSGFHTTVAGILVAFTIPARSKYDTDTFLAQLAELLEQFRCAGKCGFSIYTNEEHLNAVRSIERLCRMVEPPLHRIEAIVHPWVVFVVVPIFALANAGIVLDWGKLWTVIQTPPSLGILLGLLVGKQVGITLASWLAIKSGLAAMPKDANFGQIYGGAILCGIGFTMSIFIADLAFGRTELLYSAKAGILLASLLSFLLGFGVLYYASAIRSVSNEKIVN